MPKRTDISSILIIGAGPIVIGQACEFDYSGVQACKALRAEGYRIVLVNSNPATIMTDPEIADATYIEPITPEMVEKIIAKERPDALLPTMGGQTALNTALALERTRLARRDGLQPGHEVLPIPAHQLQFQIFLRGEVVVDAGLPHTDRGRDVRITESVEAALLRQLLGRLQDAFARVHGSALYLPTDRLSNGQDFITPKLAGGEEARHEEDAARDIPHRGA